MFKLSHLPTFLRPFALYSMLALAFFIPISTGCAIYLLWAVAVLSFVFGDWRGFGRRFIKCWPVMLVVAFWLLHLLGLAYSENIPYGLSDLFRKLSLVVIPISFVLQSPYIDAQKRNWIELAFLLGTLGMVLFLLARGGYYSLSAIEGAFVLSDMRQHFAYTELAEPFHPSYLSMYTTLAMSLAIQRFYTSREVKFKVFYIAIALLFAAFCYLLASRAGVAAMLVAIAIMLVVLLKHWRIVLLSLLLLGVSLMAIAYVKVVIKGEGSVLASALHSSKHRGVSGDTDDDARVRIWSCVPKAIEGRLLFGSGSGDVKDVVVEAYGANGCTDLQEIGFNLHNQYFQTLVALGIIGLLLLASIFAFPLFGVRFDVASSAALAFLFIVAINLLFESMLERIAGIMFFAFFYGLFFCVKPRSNISE